MTLYPIIQVAISAALYNLGTSLGNMQYLFDDLFLVLLAALTMVSHYTRSEHGSEAKSVEGCRSYLYHVFSYDG